MDISKFSNRSTKQNARKIRPRSKRNISNPIIDTKVKGKGRRRNIAVVTLDRIENSRKIINFFDSELFFNFLYASSAPSLTRIKTDIQYPK